MSLLEHLELDLPIIQAPMAGTSTSALAAAVSNGGGLGSIGVGSTDSAGAAAVIADLRTQTARSFNVNLFVHRPPRPDRSVEAAWLEALAPLFHSFGAEPPASLQAVNTSFAVDDAMLAVLLENPPPVVSFHFGLPPADRIAALKGKGCVLLATATCLAEAMQLKRAGIDAVVAQGYEAGGHRGVFDPDAPDDRLGTMALTRVLVCQSGLPVIAAGGIMDGQGIRAALDLGALAAQLGTAFIACPESSADEAYRAALMSESAQHTVITRAISGRPARCLANSFTAWAAKTRLTPPDYSIAYHAGRALNAAAKARGDGGFGAQWAGQGAPLARAMPAAELLAKLARELREAR